MEQDSSVRMRELMREGARVILNSPQRWLDKAILASEYIRPIADDPIVAEVLRRSNRSNLLHWATANVNAPGEPVAANVGDESLAFVRDLIQRGIDESAAVDAYRLGQEASWKAWMRTAFSLTSDPDELRELLDVSARSIASFINATVAGIHRQILIERDELARGTHAERRATVVGILDGEIVSQQQAERQLGYRFGQDHLAAVVWADKSIVDATDLDRVADVLMRAVDRRRSLLVLADAATRWVWLPCGRDPDLAEVYAAADRLRGVRVALGNAGTGIEGFRRSHLDAVTAQHTIARFGSPHRVVRFADVELAALITADPERADRFIEHTLGDLASADSELRQAVLTFIHERFNSSQAAAQLFIHRNTLLRKIDRANKLLPAPVEEAAVHIAVALEILRWRGAAS